MTTAVEPRSFTVPSRTKAGESYRVDLTADGELLCSCRASANNLQCWHTKYIREEAMNMSESTAVALRPIQIQQRTALLVTEREYSLIDQAAALALSGAIALPKDLNTQAKVAAVMLYGLELGLSPFTSIRHIYIVNGRPQPSAEVMAGLVAAREPDTRLSVIDLTDESCTMRFERPSHNVIAEYTVTKADAEKAGLWGTEIWRKYPKDKFRWHCTKRLLRIYAPDLINAIAALRDEGEPVALPPAQDYRVIDITPSQGLYNDGDDPDEPAPFAEEAVVDYTWDIREGGLCSRCGKKHPADYVHDGDCGKCRERPAMEERKADFCETCWAVVKAELDAAPASTEQPSIFGGTQPRQPTASAAKPAGAATAPRPRPAPPADDPGRDDEGYLASLENSEP